MGGADTEISDATTTVALEMAWFAPMRDRARRVSPARAALGGVGPLRARRRPVRRSTRPSPGSSSCSARRAPTSPSHAGAVDARGAVAAAARPLVRRAHQPGQPHPRHVARPPTTCRRCSTRSASPCRGDGRRARRSPCRRGGPTAPRRSTSSRRSPATTATTASARSLPTSTLHGRLSVAPAAPAPAARRAARPRDHRGDAQPVPRPRHARAGRARRRRAAHHQPARGRGERAAHVAAARACCGPSPSTSRTAAPAWRCSRSATSTRRDPGELPDEYEALGVVLAGEEAPAAVAVWREIAAAMGVGARIDQGRVPAGLHPTRSATLVAGRDADRRRRRGGARTCSRRSGSPSASPCSSSTCARCSTASRSRRRGSRRAGTRRATSTWRSRWPTTCRPRSSTRRSARRAGGAARRPRAVRRRTAAPASADGRRSLAYRLRLQAPDRNLTDADVAEVRAARSRRRRPSSGPSCAADGTVPTSPRARRPAGAGACRAGCGSSCRCSCRRCCSGRSPSPCAGAATTTASRSPARPRSCRPSSARPTSCIGTVPPPATIADELGHEVRRGHRRASPTITDELDFAAAFDRLPDAEARLLGRTLGAIQAQLSPTEVGGAADGRRPGGRHRVRPGLARATVVAMDPDGTDRDRALAILPFSVQDLDRVRRPGRPVHQRRPRRAGRPRRRRAVGRRRRRARQLGRQRRQRPHPDATTPSSAPSSWTPTAPPPPTPADAARTVRRPTVSPESATRRRRSVDGWRTSPATCRPDGAVSWRRGRRGRRRARPGGRAGGAGRSATARRGRP